MEHNIGFDYEVQKKVLLDIKLKLSGLENICIKSSDYVSCAYESKWWVGLVIELDRTKPRCIN